MLDLTISEANEILRRQNDLIFAGESARNPQDVLDEIRRDGLVLMPECGAEATAP